MPRTPQSLRGDRQTKSALGWLLMRAARSPDGAKRNPGQAFPRTAAPRRITRPKTVATSGLQAMRSHQRQVLRRDARKHLLHQFLVEAVGAGEQAGEQGAVVGQHRIVAVLE